MTRKVRAALLVLSFSISFGDIASAADLAGQWALSFPMQPTLWTFLQRGASFEATTGQIPGDPDVAYDMRGVSFGFGLIATIDLTVLEGTPGTVDFGVLLGTVIDDRMTGLIVSPVAGFVQMSGQRFTAARPR